jgi:GNAT superfamily N-acetyltransferase
MKITPLRVDLIPQILELMDLGAPYVKARTASDYWLYATLFSSTCPTALIDDELAGAVIAFRSQDAPNEVYIQDVMTHPDYRRGGIAQALIGHVRDQAIAWNCIRIYLTSEPENTAAQAAWESMGFSNAGGDRIVNGVPVITNFKGPGKDRAVYQLSI